jgi:hypothetical protein
MLISNVRTLTSDIFLIFIGTIDSMGAVIPIVFIPRIAAPEILRGIPSLRTVISKISLVESVCNIFIRIVMVHIFRCLGFGFRKRFTTLRGLGCLHIQIHIRLLIIARVEINFIKNFILLWRQLDLNIYRRNLLSGRATPLIEFLWGCQTQVLTLVALGSSTVDTPGPARVYVISRYL